MDEETKPLTPQEELKKKLQEARLRYRQSEKLLKEIETSHAKFVSLRDALNNRENGAQANIDWATEQRRQILLTSSTANDKLTELITTAGHVQATIDDITKKHSKFLEVSADVFDKEKGLRPILVKARKLRQAIGQLEKQATADAGKVSQKRTEIITIATVVASAYDDFLEKKAEIDNTETGFEAQLRRATEYADEAQVAKTKAESALVSVSKFKDESDALVVSIKESKSTVDKYKTESRALTDDIRNTLNKASAFTLSQALKERTRSLSKQMWIWGTLQLLSIVGLIAAVGAIFWGLFIHGAGSTDEIALRLQDGPSLMAVISKILFTTPLAFAVYFTTTNFSHVRDLRDKYAWKETVAKNFQNYIKLVKDEFKDVKYEQDRFDFSMDTIRDIYKEPNPAPKKRKYNIGFNKIEAGFEEEDLVEIRKSVETGVRRAVDRHEQKAEPSEVDASQPVPKTGTSNDTTTKQTSKKPVIPSPKPTL